MLLLFLQDHRETDRFLQLPQTNFHFHHAVFSSHLKSKVGNILVKDAELHINLNIDDTLSIDSSSHTHPPHQYFTHSKLSPINLVSIFRCSSSPRNPVQTRHVDPSVLTFSLSLYPHICMPFIYNFTYCSSRLIRSPVFPWCTVSFTFNERFSGRGTQPITHR